MQETSVQSLGWEKCPGEGKGYPLRYSGLENSKGSQRVGHDWATFTFAKIFLYVPLVSTLLFYFSWIYFKQHRGKICKYSEAACFFIKVFLYFHCDIHFIFTFYFLFVINFHCCFLLILFLICFTEKVFLLLFLFPP